MSKSDENVAKVHTILISHQHLTSEIAHETGISYESGTQTLCQVIFVLLNAYFQRSPVSPM